MADSNNDQVIPIDLTMTPVTPGVPIAVGAGPQGIAFSPDGSIVYVADTGAGSLTPIRVATDTALPAIAGVDVHPRELAITPDGSTAYVADNGSSNVYPVALSSGVVGTPISVGSGLTPLGIAITPDETRAYTANFGPASGGNGSGDTVTPITLSTGVAGTPITVGGGPWSIAVTPDSKTVYVGNSNDYYTGQTASRVGNPSAATTRSVVISATPQPAVSLSASSLDFGTAAVGTHSTPQRVTIINTGNAPLSISSSTVSGSQAADYTLGADGCTEQTVAENASCTVTVRFTPAAAGVRSAQLAFNDNASGSPHTIPLTGQGATLGTVTGHVTDASTTPTRPLAGALVSICPRSQNGIELGGVNCHTTSTNSSGAYTLSALTRIPKVGSFRADWWVWGRGSAVDPGVLDLAVVVNRCGCAVRAGRLLEVVLAAVVGLGGDFAPKGQACGV